MNAVDHRTDEAIVLRDIVKRFPGVVANDGVDLTVRRQRIHAIVGENGAGKSTLMKTLYGAHQPDEGTIVVDGVERVFRTPADAIAAGIGMVFQHFMLADNFTVWENIVLGHEPGSPLLLNRSRARHRIRELSERYGLDVDPDVLVGELGVGDKQRVEILKVLYRGARTIILDEPTAVLVPHEVERLFTSLRELTDAGSTVVFISHKLDEVLSYADAITVIRAGKTVGEITDPNTVTAHQLAEMMVGEALPTPETRERTVRHDVRLEVRDLVVEASSTTGAEVLTEGMTTTTAAPSLATTGVATAGTAAAGDAAASDGTASTTERPRRPVDGVSFSIHAGEIVGIAGVEGNGQAELVDAILGLRPSTGDVVVDGERRLSTLTTMQRRRLGIAHIPEDRHRDGLVLSMPLWENVLLGHQSGPPFARHGWIDVEAVRRRTAEIIRDYDVRTPSQNVACHALSGGNQQKLMVGREMASDPQILLASHPTRGVDVGAQAAIWDVLRVARSKGLATLLVSADLEELIGLSDRLLVMLRGRIVAELDPDTVTPTELGAYMTGVQKQDAA